MSNDVTALLGAAKPKLWRAFMGSLGIDRAEEALAEAFAWAWENRDRLLDMDNPVGYLYRVGVTNSAPRVEPATLPPHDEVGMFNFEPRLIPALLTLTVKQRTAVWLIHGCGWSYPDAAEAMDIGESTVGTHATRGLATLQTQLHTKEPS